MSASGGSDAVVARASCVCMCAVFAFTDPFVHVHQNLNYLTTHTHTHTVFRQGDTGNSWYIILRGSVNIIIQGKGVVCTLHEGDEFGKLALVHEAVR